MNNKIIFLKLIFYTSLILLIIISLFPGSLLGLIVFDNISRQPTLADNPIYELIPPSVNNHIFAATLNHFVFYLYISLVGFIIHMKDKTFSRVVYILFFLSIFLEILQFITPKRAFEIYDVVANFMGVLTGYYLVKIYVVFSKS